MPWGEIGAVLAVLVVIFIVGQVWFHLLEGVLGGLNRLLGKKEPTVWHTLPQGQEKKESQDVSNDKVMK